MEAQSCQWNSAHPYIMSVYSLHSLECPIQPQLLDLAQDMQDKCVILPSVGSFVCSKMK